ncbi:glycosyl hydrolase [Opitutaceae bacterium EW11]|nr:glycosyl hydrolase [Opitutaceae bacterium EW11]
MKHTLLLGVLIGSAAFAPGAPALPDVPADAVRPAVPILVQSFDLADVTLGAGPFRDAMERDHAYLLSLDPDRLLHTFRLNVGLLSSAKPYGGWEGPKVELRGHSIGHYLSACSLMYRSTRDPELKRRVEAIVAGLAECQAASPKAGFHEGYLSAFPEEFIDRVEQGKQVWAPWYTLHKIFAGLIDAYRLAGSRQALDTANAMAAWVKFRVDRLTPEQMQSSLQTEFGGMNEVLADLYSITGNPDQLKTAKAFNQAKVFDPLARGEDALDGLHANTQIPKAIGAAREYELTGEPRYRDVAKNFWQFVAERRSYVIGGHSDREHFFPVTDFAKHLSSETTETCNTYNMLKLSRHLFGWEPSARWMDFYERGLYNHILASQDPARGMFVYLMALEPGHFKTYSTPVDSFWCCVGTGMENHAKYGDTIFGHDDQGLYVNLFIPATLEWKERGVSLRQETRIPNSDTTRLVWTCASPTQMPLRIRHPAWAKGAVAVNVNGVPQAVQSQPGSYFVLSRTWKTGDEVVVTFPMALRTEELPGTPGTLALLYGPVVLAGKLGTDGMPAPYARDQLDQARFPDPAVPTFVASGGDWLKQVEMLSRDPLLFRTHGLGRPDDVTLAPFYTVHHERNAVYWQVLTPEAWKEREKSVADTQARWDDVQKRAVDHVKVGNEVSESAHRFDGKQTDSGVVGGLGWRIAQKGGFFSYELAAGKTEPLSLVCAFGSRDRGRTFEILVNDQKIAAPVLDGSHPGEFYLERFDVPVELTSGKASVSVRFQSGKSWDGATPSVFGCALVQKE